jgi:hypothetical protein
MRHLNTYGDYALVSFHPGMDCPRKQGGLLP